MNRRGFLTSLARAAAVGWIAPFVPDLVGEYVTVAPLCRCGHVMLPYPGKIAMDEWIRDVYVKPAARALAARIESDIAQHLYLSKIHYSGTIVGAIEGFDWDSRDAIKIQA